jgi:ABC-type methionine transport system ATPase subunit
LGIAVTLSIAVIEEGRVVEIMKCLLLYLKDFRKFDQHLRRSYDHFKTLKTYKQNLMICSTASQSIKMFPFAGKMLENTFRSIVLMFWLSVL